MVKVSPLVTTGHAANPDGSLFDLNSVTPRRHPLYPERITLELEPMPENPVDFPDSLSFPSPEHRVLNQRRVLELDRWVEVDGQSLHLSAWSAPQPPGWLVEGERGQYGVPLRPEILAGGPGRPL